MSGKQLLNLCRRVQVQNISQIKNSEEILKCLTTTDKNQLILTRKILYNSEMRKSIRRSKQTSFHYINIS